MASLSDNAFIDTAVIFGLVGVAVDLAYHPHARAQLTEWLLAWWAKLLESDIHTTLRCTNNFARRGMQRMLGSPHTPVRLLLRIVLVVVVLAATGLALTTWAMDQSWRDTFPRGFSYYGLPAVVAGACTLALLYHHLGRAVEARSPWRMLARLFGLVLVSGVLWLAAMHAGTWHEWQYRRSPLAYGSAWFYAEVYHEYFTGGIGSAVPLALTLVLALPVAVYALMMLTALAVKLLAPALAPLTVALAKRYQRLPRGVAGAVVLVVIGVLKSCA
jgi:hypothetical protein